MSPDSSPRPTTSSSQALGMAECPVRVQKSKGIERGARLAEELASAGLILMRVSSIDEFRGACRWAVSYRDYPHLTPASFPTLASVRTWWKKWSLNAIAEKNLVDAFHHFCTKASQQKLDDLEAWFYGGCMDDMPLEIARLFDQAKRDKLMGRLRWRKRGVELFLAHLQEPVSTITMKLRSVFHAVRDERFGS